MLFLALSLAACGGGSSDSAESAQGAAETDDTSEGGASDESGDGVAELSREELVANQDELRTTVEESVVFTACELNASTGVVDIEVELPNPTDEEWDAASIESITIGVSVNDPDGFFLADADVVFTTMAPGETATASASTMEFPDGGVVGECVVFDVVIPRLVGDAG